MSEGPDAPEEERIEQIGAQYDTAADDRRIGQERMENRVGIAQVHAGEASPSRRRGQGRRVALARQRDGQYGIWMGGRHVQSFCNEWEDITNFQLPEGFEQQIRINCEVLGEAREITSERDQSAPPEADLGRMRDPWDGADLIQMFNELPAGSRELIARQIHANHQEMTQGVPLRAQAHPVPTVGEAIDREQRTRRIENLLVTMIEEVRRL